MFLVFTILRKGMIDEVDFAAPRFLTDDPTKAFIAAREARSDTFSDCIRAVEIFELMFETTYNFHDINGRRPILVYRALYLGDNKWQEGFYGSWETMKQFAATLARMS